MYLLTGRSDEMNIVWCIPDCGELYFFHRLVYKADDTFILRMAAIWTRMEGFSIILMARGLWRTARISRLNNAARRSKMVGMAISF